MTTARTIPARFDDSTSGWERALCAFLAEKERRSGSMRTVQSYSRMFQDFFGRLGKPPDQVTSQDVFAYAQGIGLSGQEPSSVTVGASAACVSSFYRFLIRMGAATSNPCDALERPKVNPAPPRGLSAEQVRTLLAVIPGTPAGLRDRAIFLTLVLTGRRRSEVLNLKVGDLSLDDERVYYAYRGKGGKRGRRELPRPAYEAIVRALAAFGKGIPSMGADESLWRTVRADGGITDGTAYLRFRSYLKAAGLPLSGLHVLRHSAAKLRRDAGQSVEAVSAFLDHSSLAVTTTYLRRLEGQDDQGWAAVAEAIGAYRHPAHRVDNVAQFQFIEDYRQHKNHLYVAGSGSGAGRSVTAVQDAASVTTDWRREAVIDAAYATTTDARSTVGAYEQALRRMALVGVKASPLYGGGPAVYHADWDVGWDVTFA